MDNELQDEAHDFLDSFLSHVPNPLDYGIFLIATHADEEDPEKILVSATKHVSDGMSSETVKTLIEALVNLLTQERMEDETAYATRH